MDTKSATTDIAAWLKSTEREVRRAGDSKRALLRRRFDTTIDRVWVACTDRDLLRGWFADVKGELKAGAMLTVDVGAPCQLSSQILQCDPPHRLVATWSYPGRPVDQIELRLATDGGTILELEHRSEDTAKWWVGAGSGWEYALIRLSMLLQGDDPATLSPGKCDAELGPLWDAVVPCD